MSQKQTLVIELQRHQSPVETLTIDFEGRLAEEVASKLADRIEIDIEEIAAELVENPPTHHHETHHCHLKFVCVDVHFETESARHHFLARSRWEAVHKWACRKFKIATDACANLELHEGGPKGPLLNESKPIGKHEGCVNVWLVKPGPEPNGHSVQR